MDDENLSSKLEAEQKQIKDSQTSLTVILTNSKLFKALNPYTFQAFFGLKR